MSTVPTIYCSTCRMLRGVQEWHECRESFVIELEPCGHVMVRTARIEWLPHRAVA